MKLTAHSGSMLTHSLAAVFFAVSLLYVYLSFYGMRIRRQSQDEPRAAQPSRQEQRLG